MYASDGAADSYSELRRATYRVSNLCTNVFLLCGMVVVLVLAFVDFDDVVYSSRMVLLILFVLLEGALCCVMAVRLHGGRKRQGKDGGGFAAVTFASVSLAAFFVYMAAVSFIAFPTVFDALFSLKLRYFSPDAPLANENPASSFGAAGNSAQKLHPKAWKGPVAMMDGNVIVKVYASQAAAVADRHNRAVIRSGLIVNRGAGSDVSPFTLWEHCTPEQQQAWREARLRLTSEHSVA
ncbi:hypothetical protein HXX76_014102 [Chlamydomonas incerta]|uniref:Uncharacterized protein n=1 Tax=Chlamydomonas incerta TaxID=51695 RepID=A0A835SDG4_CHLIN|nr:hypothetical protein HXX76_014102 [Chlamydomonas incerta]|eukprot:KAG2424944.1 hypothetical protein HXX76_014102 [Chlamydomonas incerta]